jgi:pimeloyl-ACP methyl ester carboxylesterase
MAEQSSAMQEIRLPQGAIRYRELGEGEPIVFVHGLLVDGQLWRDVAPRLAEEFRCIVPDLPLGCHASPTPVGTDLSPPGLARIVADLLEALELERVTLVGNDTGGAICQLVATRHRDRLARLVLTPCDAFEDFLPPAFRPLQWAARVPGLLKVVLQPTRLDAVRRSPLAFGWLIKSRPLDAELLESWVRPSLQNPAVFRDVVEILRRIDNRFTLEAAERLREFDRPTLVAWSTEDRFFKFRNAKRLAETIPDARLEPIEDARTFVPLDQPERLAELIGAFMRETSGAPTAAAGR